MSALSKKKKKKKKKNNQIVNRSKVLLNDICYFSRLQPITFWIVKTDAKKNAKMCKLAYFCVLKVYKWVYLVNFNREDYLIRQN